MRVLFVNENIGGHATVHRHLRAALPAHPDVEADFLDVPAPSLPRRAAGVRVPGLAGLDLDLQPLRAQLALSGWVRRRLRRRLEAYDVVHVYTANAGLRSAALLARVPSVVSLDATNATNAYRLPYRSPTRFTPATVRLSQRFERRVYAAATVVVANSAWVAASLRDDYGLTDDRLRVLPFGILAPDFPTDAAPGTTGTAVPRLVFVGRQLDRKGGLRLLRLHQRHLVDSCELVLVTSEPVPPARNVTVVDDISPGSPRLWEVLRAGAVFCFPSPIDQAPNAVLEAMAAGLPVVGLSVAAVPEMITPDCGRLVVPGDDEGLVAMLRDLLRHACLRAELGAAAHRRFRAHYDAEVSTRRLVAILAEAIDRHAGPGPAGASVGEGR